MSGTVCCYAGCKKSYSTNKETSFFKFPDDPKRRKKWMQNCGNLELEQLNDRQLRGKRICSDHFTPKSFQSKTALKDAAVPIVSKHKQGATTPAKSVKHATQEKETVKSKADAPGETPSSPKEEAPMKKVKPSEDIVAPTGAKGKRNSSPAKSQKSTVKENVDKDKGEDVPVETTSSPKEEVPTKKFKSSDDTVTPTLVRGKRNLSPPKSQKTASKEKDLPPEKTKAENAPAETPSSPKEKVPSKKIKSSEGSVAPTVAKNKRNLSPAKSQKSIPKEKDVDKPKGEVSQAQTIISPKEKVTTKKIKTAEDTVAPAVAKNKRNSSPAKSQQKPTTKEKDTEKSKGENAPAEIQNLPKEKVTAKKIKSSEDSVAPAVAKNKRSLPPAKSQKSTTTKEKDTQKPKGGDAPVEARISFKEEIPTKKFKPSDNADSYDEYVYFDHDFEYTGYEEDADERLDREFERFYASLKKFLHLSAKWTMGGVQWDPQGKRKVIIISEPEIPPNGRPIVKRCLQFFEDKAIRVFIDGMDMTDAFGMTCYAEKEDVANLICRVAEASSCLGIPEMVVDDLIYFPNAKRRNTSYFDPDCPGVIPNDFYEQEPMCSACKHLQDRILINRKKEKQRLLERRMRSQEKGFEHPFGKALYSMFNELVDETDPSKPKKKRAKETFFRKYLHDTRYKMDGDSAKTERVYIEKPISVDSVSASFQDIVSKLGFNMPNAKKKSFGASLPRATSTPSTYRPARMLPSKLERKLPLPMEHISFSTGSSFTFDDGQEYEVIGEVDSAATEIVEMKPATNQQYEIIEVDDETLAKLASSKNPVVVLPDAAATNQVTRIDANDPNLSQFLKAINTSHGFR